MASQTALDWLARVLPPLYESHSKVFTDVANLLSNYTSLKIKTEVYTDNQGQSDLLLCIYGTIPTTFSGNTYRIPVMFWIPRLYPSVGPLVFVKPTPNMLIHPGNHVDINGICYHPYLSYWQNGNSINEFVEIMRDVFSKEPPVYAKPPNYDQLMHGSGSSPAASSSSVNLQSQPQQPPPPHPAHTQQQSPPPPPLPPQHPHVHTQIPQTPQYQYQYQPHPQTPVQQPPPVPTDTHPAPSSTTATPPTTITSNVQVITPEPRSISILEQDIEQPEATPPARPPNPEKLQAIEKLNNELTIITNDLNNELNTDENALKHTEQTLTWMENQLQSEQREYERLSAACKENESILDEKMQQAKNVIEEAKNRGLPDVDTVVCAENAVYNQLYDLVAEDHAIDDTIYALGKIHDQNKISFETFTKRTRSLARDQFLTRALICKISDTINV